jgi:hypothetical protein
LSQEAWNVLNQIIDDASHNDLIKNRRLAIAESFIAKNTTFETEHLLSDLTCKLIIDWATENIRGDQIDTVDGMPEWQCTVLQETIERICTSGSYDSPEIRNIIKIISAKYPTVSNVAFFIRKYGVNTRIELPWHCDYSVVSGTIHLLNQNEYTGGDFSYIEDKEIKNGNELKKGHMIFHNGDVIHCIEPITKGIRWSLVVFFYDKDSIYSKIENKIKF